MQTKNDRFKNPAAARSVFDQAWRDGSKRRETTAMVRNQLEGGLPYDPEELIERGTGHLTNVNFGDSSAMLNRAVLPYWKMVHNVPNVISAKVLTQTPDAWKYGKIFAQAFDHALKVWGLDYIIHFNALIEDAVAHGVGGLTWHRHKSGFQSARFEDILFPPKASILREKSELVMVRDNLTLSELYAVVDSDTTADYAGWSVPMARKLIHKIVCELNKEITAEDDWTRVMDELQNNDLAYSARSGGVNVVHFYVRNREGKIDHMIVPESAPDDNQDGKEDWLCKEEDFSDDWQGAFGLIVWEVANLMVHGIKGFAIKNFAFSNLLNRTKSGYVDSHNLQAALNFMKEDSNSEAPLVEAYGPYNVFPSGLKEINVYPQSRESQNLINMLERNQAENAGIYRESQQPIAEVDTAKQAEYLASIQAGVAESQAALFLAQASEVVYRPLFDRLRTGEDEIAKAFQARCVDLGIPEELIGELEVMVNCTASPALSDPTYRQSVLDKALELRNEPGIRGHRLVRAWFANRFGAEALDEFTTEDENTPTNMQAVQKAMGETADMGQGFPVPVAREDEHTIHIEVHMGPLAKITQRFAQTQEYQPDDIVGLSTAMDHIMAHFEYLKNDETRKQQYKQLWAVYTEIQSVARGLLTKAQRDARQQQAGGNPQPQPNPQ